MAHPLKPKTRVIIHFIDEFDPQFAEVEVVWVDTKGITVVAYNGATNFIPWTSIRRVAVLPR